MSELRKRLDGIDDKIIALLAKRMALSEKVGEAKSRQKGREDYSEPAREAKVIRRLQKVAGQKLPKGFVDRIYREIMAESLRRQKPLTVSYLGPEGTFSHEASLNHFGGASIHVGSESIEECMRAVEQNRSDRAIVPYENSTEGGVGETLDLLAETSLVACGEAQLRVCQNLLGKKGKPISGIKVVHSHQQSLAQCRHWLSANLPGVDLIACASNSAAARLAAKMGPQAAAIGPAGAAKPYGLEVLASDIEDHPHNITRFLVLGRSTVPASGNDKTTLTITIRDKPGALFETLKIFADAGLNLSRLESRPVPGKGIGSYRFFIDVLGHVNDRKMALALDALAGETATLKVVGSYPRSAVIG